MVKTIEKYLNEMITRGHGILYFTLIMTLFLGVIQGTIAFLGGYSI